MNIKITLRDAAASAILVIAFALAGGASSQPNETAAAPAAPTAPAPDTAPSNAPPPPASPPPSAAAPAQSGKLAAPPAGKGQIVFFRRGGFVGAAVVYKVREGTEELGTLSPGRYFVVTAEPGKHTYAVHSESKDLLTLEVDPDETYYVEGTVQMGMIVGRPQITPSEEKTFDLLYPKLKLATK